MFTKRSLRTKKDIVEVTFEVDRPDVEQVDWVAETNDWDPVPMKRTRRGNGRFRLRTRLPKDQEIQFRYLLDGEWENDEAADAYWPNEHGTDNSVIVTHA